MFPKEILENNKNISEGLLEIMLKEQSLSLNKQKKKGLFNNDSDDNIDFGLMRT